MSNDIGRTSERELQATFAIDEAGNAILKSAGMTAKCLHQQITVGTPDGIDDLVMVRCDMLLLPLKVIGVFRLHAVDIVR